MRMLLATVLEAMAVLGVVVTSGSSWAAGNDGEYWGIDREDSFLEPHCPLQDGVSMLFLRQKFTLQGYETILRLEFGIDDETYRQSSTKRDMETFVPVLRTPWLNAMVGLRYEKSEILAQDPRLDTPIQLFYTMAAVQVPIGERSNIYAFAEYSDHGDETSFNSMIGNELLSFVLYTYAFSREWQLAAMAGTDWTHMEHGRTLKPVLGLETRWQPNRYFKAALGVPVLLDVEWSAGEQWDVAANLFYTLETGAFVRYKVHRSVSLSLVYDGSYNKSQ